MQAHFLPCAGLDESESQGLNALTQATACANVLQSDGLSDDEFESATAIQGGSVRTTKMLNWGPEQVLHSC